MKQWLIGALVAVVAATSVPTDAEAGVSAVGGSSGLQRSMPARHGAQRAPAQTGHASATAAGRACECGNGWCCTGGCGQALLLGPIAGLAAGLGIAALMSHFGMGEAFGNFLMAALLPVAAIFLVRFVMRRMAGGTPARGPALAGAGRSPASSWQTPAASERSALDASPATPSVPQPSAGASLSPDVATAPAVSAAFVPAAFDSEASRASPR